VPDSPPENVVRVSATSVAAGDVLGGKYRVDGQLGAGGMGVVLSATHLELDAPVAIKVVRDEFARSEEVVSRMLFEARAVAKLKSQHVVRVLDVARLESGAPYLVMERLEGCDLATLLSDDGPLPVQQAVDYVLQACEGLAEAHALGIIHRDLKPENLFRAVTREGFVVKLLDFGISKDTGVSPGLSPRSVMTTAGYTVGSPYYMSPEQMRALEVDARADIWSLGAILYELTSGRCAFEGESLPVVCASVLSEGEAASLASIAPRVPEGLAAVVARCLRKDRAQRFESVADLAGALRSFASVDGQRSADRSSRPAFGSSVTFKSDRLTVTPAPMAASMGVPAASLHSPSRRYLPLGAALFVLLGVAFGWAALRSDAKSAAPSKPVVVAAPRPVAVTTVAAPPAAPPAVVTTPPSPSSEPKAERARSRAVAAPAAPAVSPAPAPASAAAKPATPPASPTPAAGDPFDPDRLGGRY
jgi:serine/threonine protein kinase